MTREEMEQRLAVLRQELESVDRKLEQNRRDRISLQAVKYAAVIAIAAWVSYALLLIAIR